MEVVIIGASGLVGSHLIEELALDPKIKNIKIITRRLLRLNHPKFEQFVLINFSTTEIENLDIKGDVFICTLGTTIKTAGDQEAFRLVDYDYVVSFSRLAKKSGAKSLFINSSLGANANSKIFYNRVKGEMENAVKECGVESIYFLRPSLLIGKRKEFRGAEKLGIFFYLMTGFIFPKKVRKLLGTRVIHLVQYVHKELKFLQKGVHIVSDFQ
ncbi:NADH(P)-binding protein, PF13460 family [Bacteriovorax sp. Seq25_V]|uniref:NADH(P)-binding protein, PF13460 family n=1 Tax=Bacteriovorax sp. Seq25_V TaxID=1201288 RepID=UPI00038A068B|nr:NADH(P)-binding protein, PF13460 family [Bacteriovorax sp. Seq25_V]EQC47309.1 NADH(P)-binding protein, PF13460 family [Bacteriovorax sp. Seq25_V]